MCTKGTPARVRAACRCSHAMAVGAVLAAACVLQFMLTHIWLMLALAGLVVVATAAVAYVLMRLSRRMAHHAVLVYRPHEVEAQEAAPALPDVVGAAERIARLAAPAPHES